MLLNIFYIIKILFYFLENQSKEKQKEFIYGYHSSQIAPYTLADCKRFVKIIIPAIRTLFQFIVTTYFSLIN